MVVWLMSGHAAAMSRLPTTCLHFAKPLDMSVRMSALQGSAGFCALT